MRREYLANDDRGLPYVFWQVDPEGNPDMVMSYGDDVPRPATVRELRILGVTPATNIELKPTNPKDAIGSDKLPIHLWPETATIMGTVALLDGALKYGRSNWREAGVRATIYIDALRRHLAAYAEGEDIDPDSGAPHLAHILACAAILVDAGAAGKLTDDRCYNGAGYRRLVEEMTPHVGRLKSKHADKSPKHYTIEDSRS
jgi:hypothetical protein